jgi:hypothetical protein
MRFLALFPLALAGAALARGSEAAPPPDPDISAIVSAISPARIQRSIVVLTSFKTRHTLSDPLPSGDGIGGAGAWVRAEFERVSAANGGRLRVETDEFDQKPVAPAIPRPVRIVNIFATLPGSRPDSASRIYVISAHYDCRSKNVLDAESAAPGADDDASGVAAVLETARVMSHYEFGATIIFMAVAGAEEGFVGSAHWAEWAKQKKLNIDGMLNDDIIGSTHAADGHVDRHTVRLFAQGVPPLAQPGDALLDLIRSGGENDTPPRELARAIRDIGAEYEPSMNVRIVLRADRYTRGGDHLSFIQRGYPAVRFVEPAENFRHQRELVRVENGVEYGDTTEFIDFIYVADVARLNAATLAVLARAPAPPAAVEIETARLENDTTLRWAPNTAPDLAGYRIVWRETTDSFWEHSMDVAANVTRATVPGVSKDNVVFGVEAFDAAGHVSRAVYPTPRLTL